MKTTRYYHKLLLASIIALAILTIGPKSTLAQGAAIINNAVNQVARITGTDPATAINQAQTLLASIGSTETVTDKQQLAQINEVRNLLGNAHKNAPALVQNQISIYDNRLAAKATKDPTDKKKYLDEASAREKEVQRLQSTAVSCVGWDNLFNAGWCMWQFFLKVVAGITMALVWLLSWILWGINGLFSLIIWITVQKFGDYLNHPGLKIAWSMARDLVNVSLLFFLIYAAIGLIMNLSSIDSKRIVTNVIIVALLVNFSLFFTGTVIKASNTVTNFLYTKVNTGGTTFFGTPDISTKMISGFMPVFGKQPDAAPAEYNLNYTFGGIIANFLSTIAIILITSVALGAGLVMFFVRFIKLLMYAAISPLAFLGFTVPKFKDYSGKWLDGLINMCLFPIFFLLFLWMAAEVAASSTAFWTSHTDSIPGSDFFMKLTLGILINGLVVGGLMISSSMGATGAKWATSKLKDMGNWTKGKIGQGSLGKLGYMASRGLSSTKGQGWMARNPRIGMTLKNWSEKVSKAKFGGKGSYQKTVDEKKKFVDQLDSPENKAEFIKNIGKPTIPVLGHVIPGLRADKTAQQAIFEKLKPEDQAKVGPELEKMTSEPAQPVPFRVVRQVQKERNEQEAIKSVAEGELKKLSEKDAVITKEKEKLEELKQQTLDPVTRQKLVYEQEQKVRKLVDEREQIRATNQQTIDKSQAKINALLEEEKPKQPKNLFQTLREKMTEEQRKKLTKAEKKNTRDKEKKGLKEREAAGTLDEKGKKRLQEIYDEEREEKAEADKALREKVDKLEKKDGDKEGGEKKEEK